MKEKIKILESLREHRGRYLNTDHSKRLSKKLLDEVNEQQSLLNGCSKTKVRDCVYVLTLRSGHGFVKIGTTNDLYSRISTHQHHAYGELALLGVFHGGKGVEAEVHRRFAAARIWTQREHFYATRQVRRWIEDVCRISQRGVCWACHVNITKNPAIREKESLEVCRVDRRCSDTCRPVFTWFDIAKQTRAASFSPKSGMGTQVPNATARWLFEEPDSEVPLLGIFTKRKHTGLSEAELSAARAFSNYFNYSAKIFFPEGEEMPEGTFSKVVQWARALFNVYGVAAICNCRYWKARNEADTQAINLVFGLPT